MADDGPGWSDEDDGVDDAWEEGPDDADPPGGIVVEAAPVDEGETVDDEPEPEDGPDEVPVEAVEGDRSTERGIRVGPLFGAAAAVVTLAVSVYLAVGVSPGSDLVAARWNLLAGMVAVLVLVVLHTVASWTRRRE